MTKKALNGGDYCLMVPCVPLTSQRPPTCEIAVIRPTPERFSPTETAWTPDCPFLETHAFPGCAERNTHLTGCALGLDRIITLLEGKESIRDVIAFPRNKQGVDPMSKSPLAVDNEQLKDLYIQLDLPKKKEE